MWIFPKISIMILLVICSSQFPSKYYIPVYLQMFIFVKQYSLCEIEHCRSSKKFPLIFLQMSSRLYGISALHLPEFCVRADKKVAWFFGFSKKATFCGIQISCLFGDKQLKIPYPTILESLDDLKKNDHIWPTIKCYSIKTM